MVMNGILCSEGFTTLLTYIGLLCNVSPFMVMKGIVCSEGFTTVFTHIALFVTVNPLMASQVIGMSEGFPAMPTTIGFLSTVDSLMISKDAVDIKRTLQAFTGFLSTVNPLMSLQVSVQHERFSALLTLRRLFPGVNLLMAPEGSVCGEGFPILLTCIGFSPV